MSRVVLSIPELGVTAGGNQELYVVSFAADLNQTKSAKASEVVAAYNETLPNLVPDLQKHALMQYVIVAVSNKFERIRPDQPVSLSGSGIILYPGLDPKGLLALHFAIIECDQKNRDLGKILNSLFEDAAIKNLIGLLQAGISSTLIASLMNVLIGQLPKFLQNDKDDLYLAHSHSGFDFDNYGVTTDSGIQDFKLRNDRAFCTLRIRVID